MPFLKRNNYVTKLDGYNKLKRSWKSIFYRKQRNKKRFIPQTEGDFCFTHVISLEVLVGKRQESKNTPLIKDKESHFLLKL